jgi:ATP-binding cassette subfamily F protein 3
MISFRLDRVSAVYASKTVFSGLSWEIRSNRVAGLVGPNGAGKSTLLRIVAGELAPDEGGRFPASGLTVGYLQQEPEFEPGRTVWQEAVTASPELDRVEAGLARFAARLADPGVYGDEKKLAQALAAQEKTLKEFERLGGPHYEGRVRSTLLGLGFGAPELDLPVEVLSGGQKKLLGLAKLLVVSPDLLLLDEPDNHLDLSGKDFLEKFIRGYPGAVVIVSHDRYLLDIVVDEIVELEDGRLTQYPGNYSEYAFEKQARLIRQQQLFQAQHKEIRRLEQSAKRLLMWGHVHDNNKFITRGKSMLKRIEKIERIEKPVTERKRMGLKLKGWRGSEKVLEVSDLHKSFPAENGSGGSQVLDGLDLLIWHGERVGLVGPNGAGKSVFFRLLLGDGQPDSGEIRIGPSVQSGYYAQQHESLDYDKSLIETIRLAVKRSENDAVAFLGKFLFSYEQSRGPVANLSGGERSRLQMALLMLSGANFLLLDEPTNNLDIQSAEVLEENLEEFEGTVFVISHDRYFLDRVVNRIVELEDGRLTDYAGNYGDFQETKLSIRR